MLGETELTKSGITKGSEVEVRSDEEGFKNAWYRAILQETPSKSRRKKLQIRYSSLLGDDFTPLDEIVDPSFIRPLPPKEMVTCEKFEEGDIVDAIYRDGWWTGVVRKVLENGSYVVCFDDPPDVIVFEGNDLRAHLDWIAGIWVRPKKQPSTESLFGPGTTVEVRPETQDLYDVWVQAIVLKENEDGTVCVKHDSLNNEEEPIRFVVDSCKIRPTPLPCKDTKYDLRERVEVRQALGWREGVIREILTGKTFTVCFERTNETIDVHESDLRPCIEWKDGVWITKSKTCLSESDALCISSSAKTAELTHHSPDAEQQGLVQLYQPSKRLTEMEKERPVSVEHHGLSTPTAKGTSIENEAVIHNATAKCSDRSQKRKRGRPFKHTSLGLDPKAPRVSDDSEAAAEYSGVVTNDDQLLTKWVGANLSSAAQELVQGLSSAPTANAVKEQPVGIVSQTPTKDAPVASPFEKRSPIWDTIEAMQVFKDMPQRPHFSPLIGTREEYREGAAIGKMVAFAGMLEKLNTLQLDHPRSTLESLKESLLDVQRYGFDAICALRRVDDLLYLKDNQILALDRLHLVKRDIEANKNDIDKCEQDIQDITRKIDELKEKQAEAMKVKELMVNYRAQLESSEANLQQGILNVEREFKETINAPWKSDKTPLQLYRRS